MLVYNFLQTHPEVSVQDKMTISDAVRARSDVEKQKKAARMAAMSSTEANDDEFTGGIGGDGNEMMAFAGKMSENYDMPEQHWQPPMIYQEQQQYSPEQMEHQEERWVRLCWYKNG